MNEVKESRTFMNEVEESTTIMNEINGSTANDGYSTGTNDNYE